MRESEEYIEDNKFICCNNSRNVLDYDDVKENVVKLAYKEGYLEAINDALDKLDEYGNSDQRITSILKGLL